MRIAVVGGTGFIGSRLVEKLEAAGHEVSAHARNTGLDLLTGEGLPQAVEGAEVVVNTIDAPSFDAAATPFFRSTTQNLLQAAQVSAQQQVVEAEAKAKANDTLDKSLTQNVLKQNYIDTLAKLGASGNVVVVPEGFGGIVNVK